MELLTESRKEIPTLPRDRSPGLKLDSWRDPDLQVQGGCFEQVSLSTAFQTRDQAVSPHWQAYSLAQLPQVVERGRASLESPGPGRGRRHSKVLPVQPGQTLCTTYLLTKGAGCGSRNSQGPESLWGGPRSPIIPFRSLPDPACPSPGRSCGLRAKAPPP